MPLFLLLSAASLAGPYTADEQLRFGAVEPEVSPVEAPGAVWTGGARGRLDNIVAIEARLHALGARPDETTLISAQLDWGTLVKSNRSDGMRFERPGITVRAHRLSDGATLRTGQVVDEKGSYDLEDPEARERLCTRARAGGLGELSLHTWTGAAPVGETAHDPGFLMVESGQRTAVVDLQPGESATVVEVMTPDRKRKLKVRRSMTVDRGDKVLTLTEGDVLQRICLDF